MTLNLHKIKSTWRSRDFRVFILFLLISIMIWHIEKLRQTYRITTDLEVVCEDVPNGYITPQSPKLTVPATVEGIGFSLLRMNILKENKVTVSVGKLSRLNSGGLHWALYQPKHKQEKKFLMPERIQLIDFQIDTLFIPLLTIHKKLLPVRLNDHVTIQPQHIMSRKTEIKPDSVWVTGTNDLIDTMTCVRTRPASNMTLRDTTTRVLELDIPNSLMSNTSDVIVRYYVEPLTEKKITLPIHATRLPAGYSCKIFPSTATVSFTVGLSQFERAKESAFELQADFQGIRPGDNKTRVRIDLHNAPSYVHGVTYSPHFVEFLLIKN